MAIIMRNGLEANFDPNKMRAGELAIVTDARELHATFAPGDSPKVLLDGEAVPNPETAGTEGQVLAIDENGNPKWKNVAAPSDAQVEAAVTDWLDEHPEATTTVEDGAITYAKLDANLKGKADEVDELKSEIENIEPGVWSDAAKQALLNCFVHTAWIDEHGQTYYDALESALYPTIEGLRVIFTQGNEKYYPFDSLDSLKENLEVTYTNNQGQTFIVTDYTLSGTLVVGSSVITVLYNGFTANFTVIVQNVAFDNGIAISAYTDIDTNLRYASNTDPINARCAFSVPLKNRDYIFSVVDSAKYNIAGHNLANNVLTEYEVWTAEARTTKEGYLKSDDVPASWGISFVPNNNYVWIFFKKMDGTDFTTEEINNAYGTIFTVS